MLDQFDADIQKSLTFFNLRPVIFLIGYWKGPMIWRKHIENLKEVCRIRNFGGTLNTICPLFSHCSPSSMRRIRVSRRDAIAFGFMLVAGVAVLIVLLIVGNERPNRQPVVPAGQLPQEPGKVREMLNESTAARRQSIVEKLADADVKEASQLLRQLVAGDPAKDVRLAALKALIRRNEATLAHNLAEFTSHSDDEVRAESLRGLKHLGTPDALSTLTEIVRDRHYEPRWLAIDALAAIKTEETAGLLASIATDPSQPQQDRIRAIGQLATFDDPAAKAAIRACKGDADPTVAAVASAIR